jgi:hypothetical protein
LKEQLSESLTNLFQNHKTSNFISNFDKENIKNYVSSIADCIADPSSYNKSIKVNLAKKLSTKIGKQYFDAWEQENKIDSIDNLVTIFANTFDEIVEKHDTHRYSPQTVDCFLKATIAKDPAEAISECQYALHEIEMNGQALAPQEGDL